MTRCPKCEGLLKPDWAWDELTPHPVHLPVLVCINCGKRIYPPRDLKVAA